MDTGRQAQDPAQIVSELTRRVPGLVHAIVVSADGVPVTASEQTPADHLERLAAITSGLTSLAHGAARIFGSGELTQALVAMDRGTLVIMAIDDGASLAVLASAEADLDQIAYEMTMLVERSGAILTAPARGSSRDREAGPDQSRG